MRFLVLVAALAFAPLAHAQTAAPPTAEQLSAAHDTANVMLVETGAMQVAFDQALSILTPQLHQQIGGSPFYQGLTPQHQTAVMAFIDADVARIFNEETTTALPGMIDSAAVRLATVFSEQDLRDITAFMRRPAVRTQYLHGVTAGVYQAAGRTPPPAPPMTPEDQAVYSAFEQTPAGQAFNAHSADVSAIMQQAVEGGINAQRLRQRISAGMCDAAGEECPATLRAAGQGQ